MPCEYTHARSCAPERVARPLAQGRRGQQRCRQGRRPDKRQERRGRQRAGVGARRAAVSVKNRKTAEVCASAHLQQAAMTICLERRKGELLSQHPALHDLALGPHRAPHRALRRLTRAVWPVRGGKRRPWPAPAGLRSSRQSCCTCSRCRARFRRRLSRLPPSAALLAAACAAESARRDRGEATAVLSPACGRRCRILGRTCKSSRDPPFSRPCGTS